MDIFRTYTLKSLWKNRTRTIVTIIGIILSVAMITAVTTTVSSIQNFILEATVQNDGCWHVNMLADQEDLIKEALAKEEVDESAVYADITYAKLETVKRERIPYLFIGGFSGDFEKLLTVRLKEGRLPENSNELILPADMAERSGLHYKVGEKITLQTGLRKENESNEVIWQDYPVTPSENKETFASSGNQTFQIVGTYESAQLGYWGPSSGAPGYTALTRLDENAAIAGRRMAYMTLKDRDRAGKFAEELSKKYGEENVQINSFYLKMQGSTLSENATQMMVGFMLILIGIIMFGSISLIYNSFAISLNERKKQYGLLSSIGATGNQLKKSVFFEALVLSSIGIPLGVLAGIGGMAVTFYCLRDTLSQFANSGDMTIHMSAALWAVVLAAVVGFATVLISAWLPARKALKINVIDAIRQTTDIVVNSRGLKTSRLTAKIFGLEGVLASKNYKRNKRKYRATVFSLFISVVLFISASSFSDYLSSSMGEMIQTYNCDLRYRNSDDKELEKTVDAGEFEQLYRKMEQSRGVTQAEYHYTLWNPHITLAGKYLSAHAYRNSVGHDKPIDEKELEKEVSTSNGSIVFIEDSAYEKYLKNNHLEAERFMNTKNPIGIACGKTIVWDSENEHYVISPVFEGIPGEIQLAYELWPEDGGDLDDIQFIGEQKITIGEVLEDLPDGIDYEEQYGVIIYPQSAMDIIWPKEVRKEITLEYVMTFHSDDPDKTYDEMQGIMDDNSDAGDLYNIAANVRMNRALMTVLNIFSYGFILLISLIAVANVFNTISTNVFLRKREFAMLRSVGMTQKSFHKMANFECLLYGIKGLAYGLPVAIGVTGLIWRATNSLLLSSFYVPWYSIAIAVGSVFLVVFATMLYSTSKIRKDNVVETLKEENY